MYFAEGKAPRFLEKHKQVLRIVKFDKDGPGTILHDFEAMLDLLREAPFQITPGGQLTLDAVSKINAKMAHPIEVGLKRAHQKSYPPVQGLYLVLRAAGLAFPDASGKKPVLVLDKAMYQQWIALNPTERYCTLLEAWFLRGRPEIIGETGRMFELIPENFEKAIRFLLDLPDDGLQIAGHKAVEAEFKYKIDSHNLGLMTLFGFIEVEQGKPVADKGWQINSAYRTELGEAVLSALYKGFFADITKTFYLEDEGKVPVGLFQPILQPYFMDWQNNLILPERVFRPGTYTFKVSLGKASRRIEISGEAVLDTLADIILESVEFDNDHLYEFKYRNPFGVTESVVHPRIQDSLLFTSEIKIGDVPIQIGQAMTFHFDYGDDWMFAMTLEQIDPDKTIETPRITERVGKPPRQYRDWDE